MPWPALIPLAAAGLGFIGGERANQANARMSREQMRFQERMSNTQAQRAVRDYIAAGLNPALAYDRSASSPSGAAATITNSLSGAVSSALEAKTILQNLQQAKELHAGNIRQQEENIAKTQQETRNLIYGGDILKFQKEGEQNTANFEKELRNIAPGAGGTALRTIIELIKTMKR